MNDHRKRYLVADGRVSFAKVNKFLLEKYAKCEVDYALDADSVVKLGIKNFYDGIFMDLDFPIPWGVKACKALRAHETKDALEPVPIIAVIAHRIDTETIKECKEAGMQGVIETGFPKEKFMNFLSLCEKYKRNATSLPNKYSTNKHIN